MPYISQNETQAYNMLQFWRNKVPPEYIWCIRVNGWGFPVWVKEKPFIQEILNKKDKTRVNELLNIAREC
jgi:hypothetical protein